MPIPVYTIILFLSFFGFLLSYYLYHKKRRKEHIICPLRANCNLVVQSKYSKFLGIPVEILGMCYYGFTALGYGILMMDFSFIPVWFTYALFMYSTGAFLFSVYLTFIQVFTLKQLCTWCLISASFTSTIFALSLAANLDTYIPFLSNIEESLLFVQLFMFGLGIGVSTVADILFFRFLKDFRISDKESEVLTLISQIIWLAIGLIILVGFAIFIPVSGVLVLQPQFQVIVIIMMVIIINGAFMNLILEPRLIDISFGKSHEHHDGELGEIRQLAFALGPISLVSWYSIFLIQFIAPIVGSFSMLLGIYFIFLVIGIVVGIVVERHLVVSAERQIKK